MARYYLDTSIWLDLFEDRDEPRLSKSKYAENFLVRVIAEDAKMVYSDIVKEELLKYGLGFWELEHIFERLRKILLYVEANDKEIGKARDLASKRGVPVMDAMHALIARNNKAMLITRDKDFQKLKDIVESKKPEDFSEV